MTRTAGVNWGNLGGADFKRTQQIWQNIICAMLKCNFTVSAIKSF